MGPWFRALVNLGINMYGFKKIVFLFWIIPDNANNILKAKIFGNAVCPHFTMQVTKQL